MRLIARLEQLEARVPQPRGRVILVSIDADGRRTVEADSRPDLPETNCSYYVLDSGWTKTDAAQTT